MTLMVYFYIAAFQPFQDDELKYRDVLHPCILENGGEEFGFQRS